MAAELAYKDGQAQMFYHKIGGTPWHKEGVVIGEDKSRDFEWAMSSFFDYPLEKRHYFQPDDPDAETPKFIPGDAFYVYRPDTKTSLGTVGNSYEIVPNRVAFEVLKPLLDEGVMQLETGGVLRGGADAWLLGRWDLSKFGNDAREVFEKDGGILPFATVMANHSGRRGIMLGETAIRIVCANTLGAAEVEAKGVNAKRWVSVSHKGGAGEKLIEAAQILFHGVVERFERIARQYKLLMNVRLDDTWFKQLVLNVIAPDPREDPNFVPDAKMAESVVNRALKKQAELKRLWFEGKGHTGEPTAWYALNGTIEALDHNTTLWPTKAGCWRTASLLDGELSKMKAKVTDNLVNYALGV